MFKGSTRLVKRLLLGAVMVMCLFTIAALQNVSASDLSCTDIKDINGYSTGNTFCVSTTSSAGFYYFTILSDGSIIDVGP